MSVLITADFLRRFLAGEPAAFYLLDGITETDDHWYLGQSGIAKLRPSWRFGYGGTLSDSGRFYLIPLTAEDTGLEPGFACVFRQFDRSKYSETPAEYFAGWVRSSELPALEGWIAEMNQHLVDVLALKHMEKGAETVCPSCGNADFKPKSPMRREPEEGQYVLRGSIECGSCGYSEPMDQPLDYWVDDPAD